jgi:hypothetical protein
MHGFMPYYSGVLRYSNSSVGCNYLVKLVGSHHLLGMDHEKHKN